MKNRIESDGEYPLENEWPHALRLRIKKRQRRPAQSGDGAENSREITPFNEERFLMEEFALRLHQREEENIHQRRKAQRLPHHRIEYEPQRKDEPIGHL